MRLIGIIMSSLALLPGTINTVQAAFDSSSVNRNSEPVRILRITPAGMDVPGARQIVFKFNQAMVPVGRMERKASEIPVTITPAVKCEWRWLNTTTLACQFNKQTRLRIATRYRVHVKPGFKSRSGKSLLKPVKHEFTTKRPRVTYSYFSKWRASGVPVINVYFDQDVFDDSVRTNLFFLAKGKRYNIRVSPRYKHNKKHYQRAWLVEPVTPLPADSHVFLRVEPGLMGKEGPIKGVEKRVVKSFYTFPKFRYLGILCTGNDRKRIKFKQALAKNLKRCSPDAQVYLRFSAPYDTRSVFRNLVIKPKPANWDKLLKRVGGRKYVSYHTRNREYTLPLYSALSPWTDYHISAGRKIVDYFQRPLQNRLIASFSMDHYRPAFRVVQVISVLEKIVRPVVPFAGTNLKKVTLGYSRLDYRGWQKHKHFTLPVEPAIDKRQVIPLDLRKLLGGNSGLIIGHWQTSPVTPQQYTYELGKRNTFMTQVTPFHVHVKLGHHNSLVWVTRIDNGQPVANARIQVLRSTVYKLGASPDTIARARTDRNGLARIPGIIKLDPGLRMLRNYRLDRQGLIVRVDKGRDLAVTPLYNSFAVNTYSLSRYRVYPYHQRKHGHLTAWGFTPQGVYKLGAKVQFKIIVRDQGNKHFMLPPLKSYRLEVRDPLGRIVYKKEKISLNRFGSFSGEFRTAKTSTAGWYRFHLTPSFTRKRYQPLRVLVTDFRPAAFRVTNKLDKKLYRPGDNMIVTTNAKLHAGGPYGNAGSRVVTQLLRTAFAPDHPEARGFYFEIPSYYRRVLDRSLGKMDGKGKRENRFILKQESILYGRLNTESAVMDDRGKYIATAATARYAARDRFVGLKHDGWLLKQNEAAKIMTLVTSDEGNPLAGIPVTTTFEYRKTIVKKVKTGFNNEYIKKYSYQWIPAGSCKQVSAAKASTCRFTPKQAGLYRMTARISDSKGRTHQTRLQRWATGSTRMYWKPRSEYAIDIESEKKSYTTGETARFMIKNPFPGAKALITVERLGIIEKKLVTLTRSIETLDLKIRPEHMPGFYLSVTMISPKGDQSLQSKKAKPAIRFGYVKLTVKRKQHPLAITIKTDKSEYRPRQKVRVSLQVKALRGKTPKTEIAVAVLDEAVFDLIQQGILYYDPATGLFKLGNLDLKNFNLLMRMLSKKAQQKAMKELAKKDKVLAVTANYESARARNGMMERKAMAPGKKSKARPMAEANKPGDAGDKPKIRALFKFLSYWNASIHPGANGKAQFSFTVPDNLTGWKIIAIAIDKRDRTGLGQGGFRVNQPLEIRPAIPNQVTESDQFEARFTVMNRTRKTRTVRVTMKASGALKGEAKQLHKTLTIEAQPFKRVIVGLPVTAGRAGNIRFTAIARSGKEQDGAAFKLTVRKEKSVEVAATYGTTVKNSLTELFRIPKNIREDVGEIRINFSPSVIANLDGAFKYLQRYPYACWEQKLTKGVMASHFNNLRQYLPASMKWAESKTLPQRTLNIAFRHQAPNGGMVYYIPHNRYVSPYLSAYTALAFNWLKQSGHKVPVEVENRLHAYLLRMIRRHEYPTFYSAGMKSTVRAVALAALAANKKVSLADLKKYERYTSEMTLFGKAHFLKALTHYANTGNMQQKVIDMIQSAANETGGKYIYSEQISGRFAQILHSSLRSQCAVLSSRLDFEKQETKRASDIPFKLVRTISQSRKRKNRWENTQENMFCMNALIEYARLYEKTRPNMSIKGFINRNLLGEIRIKSLRGKMQTMSRPLQTGDSGKQYTLKLNKKGKGRYYYSAQLHYSPRVLKKDPINSGIVVRREYSVERKGKWILLKSPMQIQQGELVRVDLYVNLPAARNFVVVDDAVPGGLEPVNTQLATASKVDAAKARAKYAGGSFWYSRKRWRPFGYSYWSFYHREILHHSVRFYSEYLPAGSYHLSYVAQAIAPGRFTVMPTHAEEMYDPDVFGKSTPRILVVKPKK